MKEIKGICPIIAVPFTADGKVDLESFGVLVHHLSGTGISAVTLFGLASEFYKLTDAEREELMQLFLKETRAQPQIAGIISITDHSWELAVERARRAEAMGADA